MAKKADNRPAAAKIFDRPKAARVTVPEGRVKVMATKLGYYDDKRRRPGDVFTISTHPHPKKPGQMQEFSDKWMVLVDPKTPERVTTGQEEIRAQHDEIIKAKLAGGGVDSPTGGLNVLEDED